MKKDTRSGVVRRCITLGLCFSLVYSSFTMAHAKGDSKDELLPPPELIIEEGETWIPGAVDPFSITVHGDEDECGHNTAPENYVYVGTVVGSTEADVEAADALLDVVTFKLSRPIRVMIDTIIIGMEFIVGDTLEGDYVKTQYMNNSSPDPNLYWYHYIYTFPVEDGTTMINACYRTFSPMQEVGEFQDSNKLT